MPKAVRAILAYIREIQELFHMDQGTEVGVENMMQKGKKWEQRNLVRQTALRCDGKTKRRIVIPFPLLEALQLPGREKLALKPS